MDALESLKGKLSAAMADARRVYESDKNDFDAGRYDGLKEAIESIERIQFKKES